MSAAASSAATQRRSGAAARGPRRRSADLRGRVRWDRIGRAAMLCVLVVLAYLYLSAGIHMFSTWRQSRHDRAVVRTLEGERSLLERQHATLVRPETLEAEARQLGMMRRGEQPYVVTGLPAN